LGYSRKSIKETANLLKMFASVFTISHLQTFQTTAPALMDWCEVDWAIHLQQDVRRSNVLNISASVFTLADFSENCTSSSWTIVRWIG